MPELYDDETKRLAGLRIYGWVSEEDAKALTIDILDTIAPLIAARALRDAAAHIDKIGLRTSPREVLELRRLADEIEAGAK